MSLAPKTIAEQPAWLESFLLQKDEAGTGLLPVSQTPS
jgi:hypothetical protein